VKQIPENYPATVGLCSHSQGKVKAVCKHQTVLAPLAIEWAAVLAVRNEVSACISNWAQNLDSSLESSRFR